MQPSQASIFKKKAKAKAFDEIHRKKINFNIGKYNAAVSAGQAQYQNIEGLRKTAKILKHQAIENLDEQLLLFEKNITARGAKVIWAQNAEEALTAIQKICKEKNCTHVVKSKSMVTEEIHLNNFLQAHNIQSIETDLGEFIQQLDNEPPYHIVTPAMHKSKEDISKLFAEKLGTPPDFTPSQLTLAARKHLRDYYVQAQVGITGANFIVADTGSIAVTENEGNARLCSAFPKTHIVIAGIEKIIPSLNHLHIFWPLLSGFGTGQKLTVYNSILSGPKQKNETDGPDEMYIILLDNGRTGLLADAKAREALYCIRCGACLNACPVYKNIGGHTYGTTYSGPIGSVITPHIKDLKTYHHLSYASSLCGQCTEVCPVKINIHELLLYNRNLAVKNRLTATTETIGWKAWKTASLSRKMYNIGNGKIKSALVNRIMKGWTKHRAPIQFSKKTFSEMWLEKNKS